MPNTSDLNQSLSNLEEELSKLKSASDEIEKAKTLAKSTLDSSRTIIEKITEDFKFLSNRIITESKSTSENLIHKSEKTNRNLLLTSRETANAVIDTSKRLQDDTIKLQHEVDKLLEKIENVDFPSRLDKLDASVAGANSAIQNIFSRFDSVERNLKDDLHINFGQLITVVETKDKEVNKKIDEKTNALESVIRLQGKNIEEEVLLRHEIITKNLFKVKMINLIFLIITTVFSLSALIILLMKLVF